MLLSAASLIIFFVIFMFIIQMQTLVFQNVDVYY